LYTDLEPSGSTQWLVDKKKSFSNFIRTVSTLFVLVILPFLWSCEKRFEGQPENILKHVVIQYNRLLSEGYSNLNMTDLLEIATEDRARKAYYHMAALGEARVRMEAELLDISFIDIKISGDNNAEVRTREQWRYRHINIDTGKMQRMKNAIYEMKYKLVRNDERWLISDAEILRADELPPNHTGGEVDQR